tara:strand:- start:2060 stop:3016 length:957 start_codon:yes stop_codon:yes gene_type:complete
MYPDNSWYSHRYILAKYCKVKNDLPIFGSMVHGYIPLASRFKNKFNIISGKRKFTMANFFFWNKKQVMYSKRNGVKNVNAIGAPFLYLHKMNIKKFLKPEGTLIMPAKSGSEIKAKYSLMKLIELVEKKFPKPYTLCVGSLDCHSTKKQINNRSNWKVVTCGNRTDKKFLFKLYSYLNNHMHVVQTFPSSSLLYSLFLKKKTYFIDHYYENNKRVMLHQNFYEDHIEYINDFKKYNFNFKKINSKKNYTSVLKILGFDCLKSRTELKKLFGWDNKIKIFFAIFFLYTYDLMHGQDLRNKGVYHNTKIADLKKKKMLVD